MALCVSYRHLTNSTKFVQQKAEQPLYSFSLMRKKYAINLETKEIE